MVLTGSKTVKACHILSYNLFFFNWSIKIWSASCKILIFSLVIFPGILTANPGPGNGCLFKIESDTFILTCNDFVFVGDDTEKDYRDKCNDVVKLVKKEFKKETGKTLTAKEVTHSFTTQMYGNHYGDLPVPGADVQTGVHKKNRSYVTYTCAYEYSV